MVEIKQKENGLRETTNFHKDVKEIGSIGENRLKEILNERSIYEDISDDWRFRIFDIDFIQYTDGVIDRERVLNSYYHGKGAKDTNAYAYEVKTDTATFKTRNLVYEVMSHDNEGSLSRSKADFVFYVSIDKTGNIMEEMLLDLKKLREWIRIHGSTTNRDTDLLIIRYSRILSFIENEPKRQHEYEDAKRVLDDMENFKKLNRDKCLIEEKYMNRKEDKTLIKCIDVDFLIKYYGPDLVDKNNRIVKLYNKYYE